MPRVNCVIKTNNKISKEHKLRKRVSDDTKKSPKKLKKTQKLTQLGLIAISKAGIEPAISRV